MGGQLGRDVRMRDLRAERKAECGNLPLPGWVQARDRNHLVQLPHQFRAGQDLNKLLRAFSKLLLRTDHLDMKLVPVFDQFVKKPSRCSV